MPTPDELKIIIEQLIPNIATDEIVEALRKACESNEKITLQIAKYITNTNHLKDSHIGDKNDQTLDAEAKQILLQIQEVIQKIDKKLLHGNKETSVLLTQLKDEKFIHTTNVLKQLIITPLPTTKTFEFEVVTIDAQGREKRSSKKAEYFIETLSNDIGLEMVCIPDGKFPMGAPREEEMSQEDERPQHIVNIKSFFILEFRLGNKKRLSNAELKRNRLQR